MDELTIPELETCKVEMQVTDSAREPFPAADSPDRFPAANSWISSRRFRQSGTASASPTGTCTTWSRRTKTASTCSRPTAPASSTRWAMDDHRRLPGARRHPVRRHRSRRKTPRGGSRMASRHRVPGKRGRQHLGDLTPDLRERASGEVDGIRRPGHHPEGRASRPTPDIDAFSPPCGLQAWTGLSVDSYWATSFGVLGDWGTGDVVSYV